MSEVKQEVDKNGNFYLTENYKADSLHDYFYIFRQLVEILNKFSATDHPQAPKCKDTLEFMYKYLRVVLKKEEAEETVWNSLDRELVIPIKLEAPLIFYAEYNRFFKERHMQKITIPPKAGLKRKEHPELAKQLENLVNLLKDIKTIT